MLKKYKYNIIIVFLALIFNSCQAARLTDETKNKFSVVATQGDYTNKIELNWIQTPFYKNYTVLRSDSELGTYLAISDFVYEDTFQDNNVDEGIVYYYKIQGYNNLGKAMFVTEPAEGYAGNSGGFSPPTDVFVNSGASINSLKISWSRAKDAVEYEILKSTDNEHFDFVTNIPFLHYIDEDVELNKTYYYQITSINKDGIPSPNRSKVVEGKLFSYNVNLVSPTGAYTDKIVLTWDKYQYATHYILYKSLSDSSIGFPVKEFTSDQKNEYYDLDVESGKLYYYTLIYSNNTAVNQSDTIRNYVKTSGTPAKPQNVQASQGTDPNFVTITWDNVEGTQSYEIARAITPNGPWNIIGSTKALSYKDQVPDDAYIYYYTVTGMNPALGVVSDIVQGWGNKPPINISASTIFGEKVRLTWAKVPKAISYIIKFSFTIDGSYNIAGTVDASNSDTIIFDHIYNIEPEIYSELYYTIEVITDNGVSIPSKPVKGIIKKITAPQNVRVLGNKTATKSMTIAWNRVNGAKLYNIYRATLAHQHADPSRLQVSHFKYIGSSENASYNILDASYPIRRYVYMIRAVDAGNAEGVFAKTEIVWRYPVDLEDFAKDVDFTIIQAQTQIPNFGYMGSGSTIRGRAQGAYEYYAGLSGSKNIWQNYSSFEVVLNGAQSVSVDIGNFSAKLNGPLYIQGLYTGTITYNNLNAKEGGFVFAGSITVEYNHPTQGKLTDTWSYTKAAAIFQSVVLQGGTAPRPPSYDTGHGE